MNKKVSSRKVTNKGLLLTFEDDTLCLLNPTKLETYKLLGIKIPKTNEEVSVASSKDIEGNESDVWMDIMLEVVEQEVTA